MQSSRVWIIVAAALLVGCSRTSRTLSAFESQLARVLAGDASRIDVDLPLSPSEWGRLHGLAGLRELVLRRGVAGDAEAEILATLPSIERLVLRESPLTDAGFRAIAKCTTLRDLNVPHAGCTADGVISLGGIPGLRSLRLGGERLRGTGVAQAVASLASLRSLHLIDVEIGDEGLDALAGMPSLQNLYLDAAGVSDEAWGRYCERHPGVHVHVDQAHHDRDPRRGHDGSAAGAASEQEER